MANSQQLIGAAQKRRATPEGKEQERRRGRVMTIELKARLKELDRTPQGKARKAKRELARSSKPENKARKAELKQQRVSAEWRAHQNKQARARYAANPDKDIQRVLLKRARKAALPLEEIQRSVVWGRDQGICYICGLPADPKNWELEHTIPQFTGGPHLYSNVAVSHPECNARKGKCDPRSLGSPYAYLLTGAAPPFKKGGKK